jgi:hypothetical protein
MIFFKTKKIQDNKTNSNQKIYNEVIIYSGHQRLPVSATESSSVCEVPVPVFLVLLGFAIEFVVFLVAKARRWWGRDAALGSAAHPSCLSKISGSHLTKLMFKCMSLKENFSPFNFKWKWSNLFHTVKLYN